MPALGRHSGTPLPAVGMTDGDGARGAGPEVTAERGPSKSSEERRWDSAPAEQRTAQATQRGEERDAADPCTTVTARLLGVTSGQFTHQRGRLGRLRLGHRGTRQHREVAVEARTGRAAPAGDRRDPGPAAHCYLFHVTPHPYESTRPGQVNPIAPAGHACIAVTGFTFPVRVLTTRPQLLSESNRFQGELDKWLAGGLRRAADRLDGHSQ